MALWFESALIGDKWLGGVRVTLADGRIATVEPDTQPAADDERHGAVIPGLCNVHSHAFQRSMAGLTETRGPASDNFWTWREQMYRFLDRLDPEGMRTIAALAYVEMLESGFTRVGEFHYVHNAPDGSPYDEPAVLAQAIGEAAGETGIGLTLLPVFYAHSDFGGVAPKPGQRRFITDTSQFARLVEACRTITDSVGVAPHSLRAVTPAELREVVALTGGPIHIHAAEQTGEVEACLRWSGQRPVEWLLDHAEVDARWCLIHATHLNDAEVDRLAVSGAVAGLCPVTEGNLGDGLFPTPAFLAHGGAFGVGTDSNVAIDAAQELRTLEYAQRFFTRSRNVLAGGEGRSTGGTLYRKALAGGAQALGVETGIAVGAPADFLTFRRGFPVLASGDGLLDSWIFAGRGDHIDGVWRAGRQVVAEGRHIARDAVEARYTALMRALLA